MKRGLEKKPAPILANELVIGECDVNDLDLVYENQRSALLQALEKRPALLARVSKSGTHILKFAIEKNYEYFVYLNKEQYTDELAQIYIYNRLNASSDGRRGSDKRAFADIVTQKSLDNKTVLNISYTTAEGEELSYMDKELGVPLSLKYGVAVTLKIYNAIELINKLDINISQLGEQKIKSIVQGMVSSGFRAYLGKFIEESGAGYYSLCTSTDELERGFVDRLGAILADYGLSVSSFKVAKLAIPKEIQYKIEDQALKIRQRRADVEADAQFARISLENYEAKLALEAKYPGVEHTLTEYEKDLALNRYLVKKGVVRSDKIDRSIKIDHKVENADGAVKKIDDIIPEIPENVNVFKVTFFALLSIYAFVSLIVLIGNLGSGMLMLGIGSLIFGLAAVYGINNDKFADKKVEPDSFIGQTDVAPEDVSEESEK